MKKVLTLCDKHYLSEGKEIRAVEQPVRLSISDAARREEVELELCEGCTNRLHELLQDYLDAGRRPDSKLKSQPSLKPKGSKGARSKCDYCDQMIVKGSGGASIHMSRHHPEGFAKEQAKRAVAVDA